MMPGTYAHLSGRITASKIKSACRTDPASPSARAAYTEQMEMYHFTINCFCRGLLISDEYSFIAASPNGVISCDCCGHGIVEIKCPFVTKDDGPRFLQDGSLPENH